MLQSSAGTANRSIISTGLSVRACVANALCLTSLGTGKGNRGEPRGARGDTCSRPRWPSTIDRRIESPHAVAFRYREERFEDALRNDRVQPRSAVFDQS
jgi:hypothetical protein